MTHIIVNIGRNVGDTPLEESNWNSFVNSVIYAIENTTAMKDGMPPRAMVFRGTGSWDGIWEDTASVQLWDVAEVDGNDLTRRLRLLADTYGQDAIALTIGGTTLIEP
jgi:hypothetical protein